MTSGSEYASRGVVLVSLVKLRVGSSPSPYQG
jgi:hypothetical protein